MIGIVPESKMLLWCPTALTESPRNTGNYDSNLECKEDPTLDK